ncbi:N-acetylmuramoyl-L-alanine amidase [Alkanindiges illinoisensis]|uniref:N-acetylmuramoyl-L-alanine amidase n=1 Tax=Alkanindiges illinoisensis TaxID=197183 RepID=UPI000A0324C6|nr:N-acetylmuramoyl-L-alanine amidase [Alkanindiges illinoisensis]
MLLKKGNTGSAVKRLQTALAKQGLYIYLVDGDFGQKTEDALKAYQQKFNVKPDGILGDYIAGKLGLVLSVPAGAPANTKPVIVLTAGHSLVDPGACNGKFTEAGIVREVRNGVTAILNSRGYKVINDGTGNDNQALSKAAALVKQGKIAIEFHLNAATSKAATGVEALAQSKDKAICQKLCSALSSVLDIPVRGGNGGWKDEGSGQHSKLAYVSAGGIILELFFISNDAELQKYFDRKDQVFTAIADVLSENLT